MDAIYRPLPNSSGLVFDQSRASDKAEHYLRSLIFSGQFLPGDRLPPERELAEQLGIARITLRAAIRSLETQGFIVVKIGSKGGPRISSAEIITRCWDDWIRNHQHQLRSMLEFRRIVETSIASLAAEKRTLENLDALEQVEREPKDNRQSFASWHTSFHDALGAASQNEYLMWAARTIRAELFLPVDAVFSDNRTVEIQNVHARILAAVRDQASTRAATEMGAHLEYTERLFKAHL
jgi:GntR family transcriptional repressor for pyruvate dehydrogenase complex